MAGWTLIVTGLVVAVIWVASGWWVWYYGWANGYCSIGWGVVDYQNGYVLGQGWNGNAIGGPAWKWWSGFEVAPDERLVFRYFQFGIAAFGKDTQSGSIEGELLLWPIPLLLWAAGVPVLRSGIVARRRANTGHCSKCGYSLAGLSEGAGCPECGKPE